VCVHFSVVPGCFPQKKRGCTVLQFNIIPPSEKKNDQRFYTLEYMTASASRKGSHAPGAAVFFFYDRCSWTHIFTFSLYSNPFSHGNRVGSDYNIMFLFNLILII